MIPERNGTYFKGSAVQKGHGAKQRQDDMEQNKERMGA